MDKRTSVVTCPNCEATILPRDKSIKKGKAEILTALCYRCQLKMDEQLWKEKNKDQKM